MSQEDIHQADQFTIEGLDVASPEDPSVGDRIILERRDDDGNDRAGVHSFPETGPRVQVDAEGAAGTEGADVARFSSPVAAFTAEQTITATPSILGGLPSSADAVTARQPQPHHMTTVQTQQHPHTPSPLPTLEELEVVDGFGHVWRTWPSARAITGQLLRVSTTTAAAETMLHTPANEAIAQRRTQRRTHYATIGGRNFVDNEGTMVRGAAPFERSNRYVMPSTNIIVDARHHNHAPFGTVDPAWLNQPWERVVRMVGDVAGEPDRGVRDQDGQEYAATQRGRALGMPTPAVGPLGQGVGQQPGQPPHSSDVGFDLSLDENVWLQQYGGQNWEGAHQDASLPETFMVPAADSHGQDDGQAWFDQHLSFPELHGVDAQPIPPQMQAVDASGPVHNLDQTTFHHQPTVARSGTNNARQRNQRNSSGSPQRPLTMFGTDAQVLTRDRQLRGLINAELQIHFQLLRGVVAGLPGMLNLTYEARHRLQSEIWVRQTQTFEQGFIATQGIDLAAMAAGGYSLDADILQRQRQLIELGIRRTNGFPLAPGSPRSEMRLTMTVLEAQLRTLRAWSRVWRERLPRGYLDQSVPRRRLGNQGDGVNAQGISAQEMEEIVAFGEFLDST